MSAKETLEQLCNEALATKSLTDHQRRLAEELREVDAQNEYEYFLDLRERKVRYGQNPNNLLIPYLLGIVDTVELEKPPAYEYGEFPDIDVDYLPMVRDHLKNKWAPEKFGKDKVCNIGSYNTFGIKSALIDMARVYSKDRHEILELTTQLSLKDDEGKPLTWDKAMELYPDLKNYCEANPEVADASRRLLNRNRGMGKHAGGLIVSSVPIDQFIPLVRDKDGTPLSAWVEGLHGQDLGPMGLIKFDLLVITNLMQIALCVKMIKERHNLTSFCAVEGDIDPNASDELKELLAVFQGDWSDLHWLNDPKAIALADRAELKCIFQFDSDGIRKMVKEGGVTNFEDLVAYTALYRPGPLGMKMHEHFIHRKRGMEPYEIHPLIQPILGVTYGILVYQEQVLKILNVVGDIPMKDCETIRKAISKKKFELFGKYKEMFLERGQINLGWTLEQVQNLWDQIAAFAEYGFNRSHACAYTYISSMLLYLKAHYPIEFFAAILSCEEQTEKMKEYKVEAGNFGVPVCPLHINKSGVRFQIVPGDENMDAIYIGFANVKGIGDAVGERIVASQQYRNFRDFLNKFGTDAGPIKALLGLRAFKEGTPPLLWKYAEWFKEAKKKREDRKKRFEASCEKTINELQGLLPSEFWEAIKGAVTYEVGFAGIMSQYLAEWQEKNGQMEDDRLKDITKLVIKYQKSCALYQKKVEADETDGVQFDPKDVTIPPDLETLYASIEESEKAFYGFIWTHPLEKSPDYNGLTFEKFRNTEKPYGHVEVRIENVERKVSQKKKTVYYLLSVEDAHSEAAQIQVWEDDWARFNDWFVHKAMLRLEVQAPSDGFRRYTLKSPPRHLRHTLPKSRDYDFRVIVMSL